MMFREIVNLICSLTGFTLGVDVVAGHRTQEAVDRHLLVQESGGGETNEQSRDMANVLIQVVSRARTYFEARDDLWLVYLTLHGTAGWNLPRVDGIGPDYLVMSIGALALPQYLGEDENRRHEFSCNFIFRMEEGSCGGGISP